MYAVHLAMAALAGASFVALSAYFMHRKTLNQLLEFAKAMERERGREKGEEEVGRGDSPQHFKKYAERRRGHGRRKGNGYYRRSSASLPDVMKISCDGEGGERRNGPFLIDGIPAGLPRLHTFAEGMRMPDFSPE